MKNILPLILIVFLSFNLKSQITVNSIDLNVGDVVLQAADTNFQTALLAPGTDLSWDFTGAHGQRTDTIAPIDPATTTYASAFPDANLALGIPTFALYFANTPNEYVAFGMGGYIEQLDQEADISYSIPDTMISFPINYGDTRNTFAWGQSSDISFAGYTGRISRSTIRSQTCDAWGTVASPIDNYDALRVQEQVINIDSVFVLVWGFPVYVDSLSNYDTTYKYNFYTNDATIKYPLLEVTYDHNADTIFETKWINFLPDQTKELISNSENISIYPNPSSNFVNIVAEEPIVSVNIINTQGKVVKTTNQNRIQISDLPSSVYFIEIKTKNNNYIEKLFVE